MKTLETSGGSNRVPEHKIHTQILKIEYSISGNL